MNHSTRNRLKAGTAIVTAALCFAFPTSTVALGLGGHGGGGGGGIGVDASVSVGGVGVGASVSVGGSGGGVDADVDVAVGGGAGSGGGTGGGTGTGGVDADVDVTIGGGTGTGTGTGTGVTPPGTTPEEPAIAADVARRTNGVSAEEQAARDALLLAKRLAAYKGTALVSSDGSVLGRVISVSYSGEGVQIVARLSAETGKHEGKTVRLMADPRALDEKRVKLRQSERRFLRGLRHL